MAEDAKSDKDSDRKMSGENEKTEKRKRGRPRKETTATEEAKGMRRFLGIEDMPYEEIFQGKDKLSRSPAKQKEVKSSEKEEDKENSENKEAEDGSRSSSTDEEDDTEDPERKKDKEKDWQRNEKVNERTGITEEKRDNIVKELWEKVAKLEEVVNELKVENILIKREAREEGKRWELENQELKEEIRMINANMQMWKINKEKEKTDGEDEERRFEERDGISEQEEETDQGKEREENENDKNNNAKKGRWN